MLRRFRYDSDSDWEYGWSFLKILTYLAASPCPGGLISTMIVSGSPFTLSQCRNQFREESADDVMREP
jgi:hypothetical protein